MIKGSWLYAVGGKTPPLLLTGLLPNALSILVCYRVEIDISIKNTRFATFMFKHSNSSIIKI